MLREVELILHLQQLDNRVAELQREIAALPRHVAEIERALESHNRKLEADRAALAANQRDRKKHEGEIQIQEQKTSRLRDQMIEARTNEQYRAFQHEIDFCQKEVRTAEDRILDLMAESEPLEQNVKAAESALKEEKRQVEAEKARARERTAADQKALDELLADRGASVAALPPQLYTAYTRIRKKWNGGSAVAETVDGRCSCCNIAFRPQFFQDLKVSGQVMFCESCGRVLYHNPPESFEADIATPPVADRQPA